MVEEFGMFGVGQVFCDGFDGNPAGVANIFQCFDENE